MHLARRDFIALFYEEIVKDCHGSRYTSSLNPEPKIPHPIILVTNTTVQYVCSTEWPFTAYQHIYYAKIIPASKF